MINRFPVVKYLGTLNKKNVVHSVWAYNSANGWSVLIRVYKPDAELWVDWEIRRKK